MTLEDLMEKGELDWRYDFVVPTDGDDAVYDNAEDAITFATEIDSSVIKQKVIVHSEEVIFDHCTMPNGVQLITI
jgi:hypothetical protein